MQYLLCMMELAPKNFSYENFEKYCLLRIQLYKFTFITNH